MPISHVFGSDLSFGPSGDIATVDVPTITLQRVLRRLLTNSGDYLWNLNYGGGLRQKVGLAADGPAIEGNMQAQMLLEAGVSQIPPPTVTVTAGNDGTVFAQVQYTDANTGQAQTLPVTI